MEGALFGIKGNLYEVTGGTVEMKGPVHGRFYPCWYMFLGVGPITYLVYNKQKPLQ